MTKEIKNYLKELGFHKNEAAVYLALASLGEAKASQIAKAAELPRTTAISILAKLAGENYLTTHVYKGITSYWIESPQVLLDSLKLKLAVAEKLQLALPDLYQLQGRFPQAKICDNKRSIKQFIEKTLNSLGKGDIIYTIDTPGEGNYRKIFPDDMENIIVSLKQKKGIITRTLVPAGSYTGIEPDKLTRQLITIRELPQHLAFQGSLWIVKGMLINFSGNPPFLAMTKHESITAGMKGLYDYLWAISAPKATNNN